MIPYSRHEPSVGGDVSTPGQTSCLQTYIFRSKDRTSHIPKLNPNPGSFLWDAFVCCPRHSKRERLLRTWKRHVYYKYIWSIKYQTDEWMLARPLRWLRGKSAYGIGWWQECEPWNSRGGRKLTPTCVLWLPTCSVYAESATQTHPCTNKLFMLTFQSEHSISMVIFKTHVFIVSTKHFKL